MKKLLLTTIFTASILLSNVVSYANSNISVYVDNQQVHFDKAPVLKNGTVLVPLRKTFEVLGATVDWDNDMQTITSTKNSDTLYMQIDNSIAYRNGEKINLTTPPTFSNGTTYVPLRLVSETFGATVSYDDLMNSVSITTNQIFYMPEPNEPFRKPTKYTWIGHYDLEDEYRIGFSWNGDTITFIENGYNVIYTVENTPSGRFEEGKTYISDGVRYKYDGKIVFNFGDLVEKGIIEVEGYERPLGDAISSTDELTVFNKEEYRINLHPWLGARDVDEFYGVHPTWMGNHIVFYGELKENGFSNIDYVILGSPEEQFEEDKIYEGNGVRYRFNSKTRKIEFNHADLFKQGIISVD